jgi:hypothetical protein
MRYLYIKPEPALEYRINRV